MANDPHRPAASPGDLDARRAEWADDSETEAASVAGGAEPEGGGAGRMFLIVRQGDKLSFLDLDDPGEWILGRAAGAAVVVDDRQVSRHHAAIRLRSRVLSIADLGSRNGTVVNGHAVRGETVRVATGDSIAVGGCQVVVAHRSGGAGRASAAASEGDALDDVVVVDRQMERLYASARKVAPMPTTVLILGETGTGKDVLARRIHAWSARAAKPLLRINCAGIHESLLESELFGHERGAFTGADRRKTGYFEAADGGTIFLDEIGELSPGAQVKLLHVLENQTVTRVGGTTPTRIDVRVLCATHRDLPALVASGAFREDLYYRISPFKIQLPPLRERANEIELLAGVFARQLAERAGAPAPTVAPDAVALLQGYAWPGNVRELRNAVEHAYVMAEGSTLRAEHFAPELHGRAGVTIAPAPLSVRDKMAEVERRAIEEALAAEGGNQTRAAARLGLPRRTLVHKLTQYRRSDHDKGDGGAR